VLSAHPTEVQPEQGDAADLGAGHLGAAVHAAPGAGAADGAPRPRAAADLPRRRVPPDPAAHAPRGLEQARTPRLLLRRPVIWAGAVRFLPSSCT
jgi:hypothetical protein